MQSEVLHEIPVNMHSEGGKEALDSITLEISQIHKAEAQGFIYRVHESLRNVNSKEYEPDILAIGPYHHGKDKYKMMEEQKLIYMQAILNRKNESSAERYISAIAELEKKARSCYVEPVNLSPDKFIKMHVLDGCYIIELAQRIEIESMRPSSSDPVLEMDRIEIRLKRDLIMFENQIPFFVLCKLFYLIEGSNKYDRLTNLLVTFLDNLFPDGEYRKTKNSNSHNVKHLLELVYNSWVPESLDGHVPDIEPNRETRFVNSAAELKEANVKFKKLEKCDSLFEVSFREADGTILMPPLIIAVETRVFLQESTYPKPGCSYVSNYVQLFDCLVNSSKDIDVVSECEVIESWLGDNETIANIINKLMESVATPAPDELVYGQTFYNIYKYYKMDGRLTSRLF